MLKNFLSLIFLFLSLTVFCQITYNYEIDFGKNRIQYKNTKWRFISTRYFEIYFPEGHIELATLAGQYAETSLISIAEKIGFFPLNPLKLIIYPDPASYLQSNIGLSSTPFVSGGYTSFIKSAIEVPFTGSRTEFETNIRNETASVLLHKRLYGNSFKEILQNTYLLSVPDWFFSGAEAFLSQDWSQEMDNFMRNVLLENALKSPSRYKGAEAILIGQSLWNFYVLKFGWTSFQDLLNYVSLVRNYKRAFELASGYDYDLFIEDWKNFYGKDLQESHSRFYLENPILNVKKATVLSVSLQNGGILFITQKPNGRYHLKLFSFKDHSEKTLLRGGTHLYNRHQFSQLPLVQWKSKKQYYLLKRKKNSLYLTVYTLGKKKPTREIRVFLNNINSFDISPSGNQAVVAGSKNIQSDIFLIDLKSEKMISLTENKWDEMQVRFLNDSLLAYSSNYPDSTDRSTFKITLFSIPEKNYKIISLPGNSISPVGNADSLLFLNNQSGIYQIYKWKNTSNKPIRKTDNLLDISHLVENKDTIIFLQNTLSGTTFSPFKATETIDSISFMARVRKQMGKTAKKNPEIAEKDEKIDIHNYLFEAEKKLEEKEHPNSPKGPFDYRNSFNIDQVTSTLLIDPLRGLGILLATGMSDLMENHKMEVGLLGLTDLKNSSFFGKYSFLKKRTDLHFSFYRKTLSYPEIYVLNKYVLNQFESSFSYPLDVTKQIAFSPFVAVAKYTPVSEYGFFPDSINFYAGISESFTFDNTEITGANLRKGFRGKLFVQNYFSPAADKNFGKLMIDLRNYFPVYKSSIFAVRGAAGTFFGKSPKSFLVGGVNNWLFNQIRVPQFLQPSTDTLFVQFVTPVRGFDYNAQTGRNFFVINAEFRFPLAGNFYPKEISSVIFKHLQVIGFSDFAAAWNTGSPFSKKNEIVQLTVNSKNHTSNAVVSYYKNPFLWGYGFGLRTLFLGYFIRFDTAWGLNAQWNLQRRYYFSFGFDF